MYICVFMYVCMCVCVYIYIYICVCVCVCMYICMLHACMLLHNKHTTVLTAVVLITDGYTNTTGSLFTVINMAVKKAEFNQS